MASLLYSHRAGRSGGLCVDAPLSKKDTGAWLVSRVGLLRWQEVFMPKRTVFLLLILWLTACVPPEYASDRPPVSPIIPDQVPVMLDNQWRLTEMIYNGQRYSFDSIEPVLVTFQPGVLSVQACNGTGFFIDTTGIADPNGYRIRGTGVGTARLCDDGGTEQESIFDQALRATNRYEIIDDTLILSGTNFFSGTSAQLTFVIDNEAEKPADWQ
jgi:hypothetical protein